ncbi:uncharacterized protein PpBr36_10872 [Pyricularia pennisetigena]|uniref:uncharacterized protein n=1 Tax=Pyricularia pennisetigena TaxID=1578925 RepID=UPI001152BF0C|nr:uncharacterized protein PpBr36_10872 [Pyricularia pennisetigena]TLS20860.1 hypothetical protein PpBr36_10872 [Pyricularia pennisetigena]
MTAHQLLPARKCTFLLHTFCATGHVLPMQAVAKALVQRGHRVIWLTSPSQSWRVMASGAEVAQTEALLEWDERLLAAQPASLPDLADVLFGGRVDAVVADIRRVLKDKGDPRIDCLVNDAMPYGAKAMFDLGAVGAWATLGVVPMYTDRSRPLSALGMLLTTPALALPVVNRQRSALGLPDQTPEEPFNYSPLLHIQASCEELEFGVRDLLPSAHFVGPLVSSPAGAGSAGLPCWWSDVESHECVVGITQGTYAVDPSTLLIPAVEALAGDKSLLLVVPSPLADRIRSELADRGVALDNVRLAEWVPYSELLPRCRTLITNGGYGSVTQALANGVPLVCAGTSEDKRDTAARVVAVGAGIDLQTDTPEAEEIRKAVRTMLEDSSFAERAAAVGRSLNGLGGATKACELLEGLVERVKTGAV